MATKRIPIITPLAVLALVVTWGASAAWAAGAANDHTVLILSPTVTGGASSVEAMKAAALGMDVEVVDNVGWGAKSAADFASYRALVLGDPTCVTDPTTPQAATATTNVWAPVVNGNVIIMGTDEVYHDSQGGDQLTASSMAFVTSQTGKTGALISLSCYFNGDPPHTAVPLLDGFSAGGFTVDGTAGGLCFNDAHIVATSPALAGLTDATLSNWSCSVHEAFDKWPADFLVLAIARNLGSAFTAADGTVGTPYIIARGQITALGLSLSPTSATNPVGTSHTVTATLTDPTGAPVVGSLIAFKILSGPNAGASGTCVPADCKTDSAGQVKFTYHDAGGAGTDAIQAFNDLNGNGTADAGEGQTTAAKTWGTGPTPPPTPAAGAPTMSFPMLGVVALVLLTFGWTWIAKTAKQ